MEHKPKPREDATEGNDSTINTVKFLERKRYCSVCIVLPIKLNFSLVSVIPFHSFSVDFLKMEHKDFFSS